MGTVAEDKSATSEAARKSGEVEATTTGNTMLEESMDQLEDTERRFAGKMASRGLRLMLELLMMEK